MSSQGFCLPQLRFRGADANNLPLAGGLLYSYAAGSATPLPTYADATMLIANPNPTTLDSQGETTAFIPAGTLYKFDLHDASDTPVAGYPIDNVEATTAAPAAPAAPAPVPTGGLVLYGGSSAPTGYLLADGSAVSRTTYAALFTAIATAFGSGDGSTTFNLPDMRQRFPLGKSASGTGAALGEAGGAIDHTHTGPSHTHGVTLPRDGWGDTLALPSISGRLNVGEATGVGQFNSSYQPTGDKAITSDAGGTGATGTQNPAYLTLNYLIKT